jgi:hypothetical protein
MECRAAWKIKVGTTFLSTEHSNQSSLEALFSWIRKVGRDRASNYAGGIVGRNVIRTKTADNVLVNNIMYLKEHISIEQDNLQSKELVLGRGLKEQEKTLNEWLSSQNKGEDNIDTAYSGLGVCILPPMVIEMTDLGNLVLPELSQKRLDPPCERHIFQRICDAEHGRRVGRVVSYNL